MQVKLQSILSISFQLLLVLRLSTELEEIKYLSFLARGNFIAVLFIFQGFDTLQSYGCEKSPMRIPIRVRIDS